jgi:hypothetical protein
MRLVVTTILICLALVAAQTPLPEPKSVTVPITLDHNRIVIDIDLPLPGGSTQRVRGWVDNGTPKLFLSRRVATLLGLNLTCGENSCSAPAPATVIVGDMKIPLTSVKEATIPLQPPSAAAVLAPGMNAEINLPSSVLRNYNALIDFPGHKLTIAQPGALKFTGVKAKMLVNGDNGLIQVPSQVDNKKYSLGLDIGSSISFLSDDIFNKLSAAHPAWPHMAGAIGPANMWGSENETKSKIMRVDRLQYGPLFLTNVAVTETRKDGYLGKPAESGDGWLGTQALRNYRIGLDYAHSTIYFEIGRTFNFPDFDVVGLTLRPEDDGRFTILAVADYEGKTSVPQGPEGVQTGDHLVAVDAIPTAGSTLGQVWSMLGGEPGKERKLTVERDGKQIAVVAKVQHFLAVQ